MSELSRRERIVLLAASREDYLPGPWLGRSESGGEGPSERALCGKCDGLGRLRVRNRIEPCSACASKGVVDVDSYTGRVVATVRDNEFAITAAEIRETMHAEKADWESRKRYRDRKRRLYAELDGEREGEDFVDWVLRRRRVLYRAGDYGRLAEHLAALPEYARRAFLLVYGPEAADRVIGPRLQREADVVLDWLEGVMPRVPRVPEWLKAPRVRDEEILKLARAREPHATIAQRVGCSSATVSRVLARLA